MALKLIHFCNANSTNIGNGALIYGTEALIEEDLKKEITWKRIAWDDYTFEKKPFDLELVKLFNESDGVVVNGAVAFNGRPYLSETGFRFNLPLSLWPEIRVPMVFYGLSYRLWPGETYHHADKLHETLKFITQSDNMLLAVRNDGTKEWLEKVTGFSSDRISVVPDPGLFIPRFPENNNIYLCKNKKNIVISFNNEDSAFRYKKKDEIKSKGSADIGIPEILQRFKRVILKLAQQYPLNIILATHYFDDIPMAYDFINLFPPAMAHQDFVITGICGIHGTHQFYDIYKGADLAYSMRVHSMSPCIGLGVPMIPVVSQNRMIRFLENLELSDMALNPFSNNFEEDLFVHSDEILKNTSTRLEKFEKAKKHCRNDFFNFNKKLLRLWS